MRRSRKENIYVLEKAREAGQHCLSGALLDPRSMRELLPGFESEAPIDAEVTQESVYFLTEKGQYKFPIVPPPLRDHGNYVISINKFVKWLAAKVEEAGITIFTGFAGSELLFDDDGFGHGVIGVRTDDKGVDKQGEPKANFEPGYDLHAKITVLAEGTRGNCAKALIQRLGLEDPNHAQTYGIGIKELWEIPAGRVAKGEVIYTLGYPLTTHEYGGAWIYGISDTEISIGYVTGLDYQDPRTDPHHVFQSFKLHPLARRILEGGKMVRYGAKTLPLRRLAHHAAACRRWLDAAWRQRQFSEFATAEGHPSGDQVRHARGRDCLRRDGEARLLQQAAAELQTARRRELDSRGALPGAQLPPGLRAWADRRAGQGGNSAAISRRQSRSGFHQPRRL